MPSSNLKTFLAIILSLVIFFGGKYALDNQEKIKSFRPQDIRFSMPKITLPNLSSLISLNFLKPNYVSQNPSNNNQNNSLNLETIIQPTVRTYEVPHGPTDRPVTPINKTPTKRIIPTSPPRPTSTPKPTATPKLKISEVRPGRSIQEMADMVQEYTCTPASLIMAAKSLETGSSFLTANEATIEKYNTYDWWNNAGSAQEICDGYAYNVIKGTIPADSKFPGYQCKPPLGKQTYPYAIMGILPLDDAEQNAYIDDFQRVFETDLPVDRRVFFDAMMMVGFHFKNISLERGTDCENWDLKYITKVACKYQGGCQFTYTTGSTRSGDYCFLLCEKYNEYAGTSYNCESAANYVDPYCNFK